MVDRPKGVTPTLGHIYIEEAIKDKWKHRNSCLRGKPHTISKWSQEREGGDLGHRREATRKER